MGHAGGDMVDNLSGRGGVVRCGLSSTAIALEASHEATVSGKVHLSETYISNSLLNTAH